MTFVHWIRSKNTTVPIAFGFWIGFMKVYPWVCVGIAWKVGNDSMVHLGVDMFIRGDDFYRLSHSLIN